ncbi:hypothetical protein BU24DRAFT_483182 [Aaosphaeria arxii CBS 175.79]|uniref:Uncharacterized protein n=1 Tax=Aaosphaeria arxii CBS 175.79 TaxID=1450172 RepID=A0A6A5XKG5_9PLEO|nr:uncharacterized protein BU24DRAFT_483182 [Aaosphaeria arxii CBS 175.79]KAF2013443.1 hypothetical protein BU24DRAFT_483182 [Aaosphaeria arxii CBS 175.79]
MVSPSLVPFITQCLISLLSVLITNFILPHRSNSIATTSLGTAILGVIIYTTSRFSNLTELRLSPTSSAFLSAVLLSLHDTIPYLLKVMVFLTNEPYALDSSQASFIHFLLAYLVLDDLDFYQKYALHLSKKRERNGGAQRQEVEGQEETIEEEGRMWCISWFLMIFHANTDPSFQHSRDPLAYHCGPLAVGETPVMDRFDERIGGSKCRDDVNGRGSLEKNGRGKTVARLLCRNSIVRRMGFLAMYYGMQVLVMYFIKAGTNPPSGGCKESIWEILVGVGVLFDTPNLWTWWVEVLLLRVVRMGSCVVVWKGIDAWRAVRRRRGPKIVQGRLEGWCKDGRWME